MAAITGYLGRSPKEIEKDEPEMQRAPDAMKHRATAGYGDASQDSQGSAVGPSLNAKHGKLTKMVWHRRIVEDFLAGCHVELKEDPKEKRWYFYLDPALPKDIIPWAPSGAEDADAGPRVGLWGWAGKMACPTWDLPAGPEVVGGACPGAAPGQTVIEPSIRNRLLHDGKLPAPAPGHSAQQKVNLNTAICGSCYAYVGQYPQPNVQAGEILRYWWAKEAISDVEAFSDVVVRSMLREKFPETPYKFAVARAGGERAGLPLKPVRVHSSGDFFSPAYFDAWCVVARKLADIAPNVRIWAPTRVWIQPKWQVHMKKALAALADDGIDNLMVRPSAYHFNDPAPGKLEERNAMGSTSIYAKDTGDRASRYDYDCPVYADIVKGGEATCGAVPNKDSPNGRGCRACWLRRDQRVNYQAHFG